MKLWFDQPEKERIEIINQTSVKTGMLPTAIEKDWWVMAALRGIFGTEYQEHLVFKGGTSLSKAWNIIDRFSEDIDLAIDRSYFGFTGDLDRKGVTRLRKASCKFVQDEFVYKLTEKLNEQGVKDFEINITEFERSDTDPVAIELVYKSLTDNIDYLKPRILVEISSRSLRDPYEIKPLRSIIGSQFPTLYFSDIEVNIPTVTPERTMLEKIFLLHEEFQKPSDKKIRSERMTRHLYDLGKLMDTPHSKKALKDLELYSTIVKHRKMLTNISWVDYAKHQPSCIDFIPPTRVIDAWAKDYRDMQESMFYGETSSFEVLIDKLTGLRSDINKM